MNESAVIAGSASRDTGIDVAEIINQARISPFQMLVFAQCFAVSMLDGFATQTIAFVAPAIAAAWKIPPSSFGPIFSATLLGSVLGAVLGGALADRYGRRKITILSVAVFACVSLATIYATSVQSLIVFRLLTGLGLGAALPNFISVASEYAPQRRRSTIVTITLWGFPLGAAVGGAVSAHLITQFGWTAIFLLSGGASLLFLPAFAFLLPESILFLSLRPATSGAIPKIIARIAPSYRLDPGARFILPERPVAGSAIGAVFRNRLAAGTLLLSATLFASLFLTYCVLNWIPSVLRQAGLPIGDAVMGTVMFNVAGIVGSYFCSRLTDRGRPLLVMGSTYVLGAIAVAMIGLAGASLWPLMGTIFAAGFLIIGTQLSVTAFISSYYPTAIRGTGIGWTQALGRFGSLVGPLAGGYALTVGVEPKQFFLLLGVPALVASAALYGLALVTLGRNRRASEAGSGR
jgi:MFS transporter, AAHS family, 4-hydroxybenzoate transporter